MDTNLKYNAEDMCTIMEPNLEISSILDNLQSGNNRISDALNIWK